MEPASPRRRPGRTRSARRARRRPRRAGRAASSAAPRRGRPGGRRLFLVLVLVLVLVLLSAGITVEPGLRLRDEIRTLLVALRPGREIGVAVEVLAALDPRLERDRSARE